MKSTTDVKRFKETLNLGKVVRFSICISDSYRKMKDIVHHASLKYVFQKLIIINGLTCFDLKNPPRTESMRVSVETLQDFPFLPKKHRNNYLFVARLPFLDPKSDLFQAWAESCENGVAMLDLPCT